MKKILAIILASLMLLSFVACGNNNEENTTDVNNEVNSENNNNENNEQVNLLPNVIAPNTELKYEDATKTLGYYFWQKFVEVKAANADATSANVVEAIFNSNLVNAIQMPMTFELTAGDYLQGFIYENENGEEVIIDGYETGALFGSGMMGVAFIGYVFDLAEGADVDAFVKMLDENKDPRWNGCTIADMTIIDAIGNTVFMIMCPIPAPYAISGIPDVVEPATLEAGSFEEAIWNNYVEYLTDNYGASAEDICNALAGNAAFTYETEVTVYNEGIYDNFTFGVDGYDTAAGIVAKNGDSSVIVYVINNYDGMDMVNWMDYSFVMGGMYETVFGAFNSSVIAIVDTSAPIAE